MMQLKSRWRGLVFIAGFIVLFSAAQAQEAKKPGAKEWFDRGVVLQEAGNPRSSDAFKHAVQELDITINSKGADQKELSSAYSLRARCYNLLGDNQQAVEDANKAIELSPDGGNYYLRSFIHAMMENKQMAIEDLKQAARKNFEKAKEELTSQGIQW